MAFVSTNSICQGEQVGILWSLLFEQFSLHINFAHRTFRWNNEAKGNAAVHVIIIGFSSIDSKTKKLYVYDDIKGDPTIKNARNINGYLIDALTIQITRRSSPICRVPPIGIGNKPIHVGNYLFDKEEMEAFIVAEPQSANFFFPWYGSIEFLQGKKRWVLLTQAIDPTILKKMPLVLARIDAVKQFRLASKSKPTIKIATTPRNFHVENFPDDNYLLIPKVSSERREYSPIGFMTPNQIPSDLVFVI